MTEEDITVDVHPVIVVETFHDQVNMKSSHCSKFRAPDLKPSALLNVFIGKIKSPTQAQHERKFLHATPSNLTIFFEISFVPSLGQWKSIKEGCWGGKL